MRVIIIGAGEVGSHIAESLSTEGVEVAVIEKNAKKLDELAQRIDILAIPGSGLDSNNLKQAGIASADILVAVTANDEINMMAGLIGYQANVEHRIVRIENDYLRDKQSEQLREAMHVDVVIDPDAETAGAILDLLKHPGVAEMEDLGKGKFVMIGAQLNANSSLVGRSLAEIAKENEPEWNFIVGAISRKEDTVIPRDSKHVLNVGDTVRLICKKEATKSMLKQLGATSSKSRRIMVLGGGRIGEMTASQLEKLGSTVTLVDWDKERVEELSCIYDNINFIEGDISNPDLLDEEEIERMDAVVAVTGKDESNVLPCLYAQSKGVREVIAILHSLELKSMFREVGLEKTLSPTTASIKPVLKLVRSAKIKTTVQDVRTFMAMDIEVLEITVETGSMADGMLVRDLGPSKKILIGGVVNESGAQIVRGDTKLSAGDHLVVFARHSALDKVSKLFETRR